jgi:hypothetical protein
MGWDGMVALQPAELKVAVCVGAALVLQFLSWSAASISGP